MANGGSHAWHLIPLLQNEFGADLAERQGRERSRRLQITQQVQFLGEGVADARGEAEAEQRCQGKHLLGAASGIGVMLPNMQVALMMTERIDHIQCLLVRADDLREACGHPDIGSMRAEVGPASCPKIFGIVLGVGSFDSYGQPHAVRRGGGAIPQ